MRSTEAWGEPPVKPPVQGLSVQCLPMWTTRSGCRRVWKRVLENPPMLILNNKTKALSPQPTLTNTGGRLTPASTPAQSSCRCLEPCLRGWDQHPWEVSCWAQCPHRPDGPGSPCPTAVPTTGVALPALPGPLYLWTRAWAGTWLASAGLSPPQRPMLPTRAQGPHTQWSHRQTRAGSPPS